MTPFKPLKIKTMDGYLYTLPDGTQVPILEFPSENGLTSISFVPSVYGGSLPKGNTLYVDMTNGSDLLTGLNWLQAFKTIQKAIDTAVDKAGTIIYVTGSGTGTTSTTEGVIINKENVHLKAYPPYNNITGCNASISTTLGFGGGDANEGNFAAINITKSKVSIEGFRITATSVDYPVGIQSLTNVNSQLDIRNCKILVSGTNTGRAIKFRTAASGLTVENCYLYGGAASKMNNGIIFEAGSANCHFKRIVIANTEGQGIYNAASVGDIYEEIFTLPTCATGVEIVGITSILTNSRILGTAKYGAAHTAINIGNLIAADI